MTEVIIGTVCLVGVLYLVLTVIDRLSGRHSF